MATNSFRSGKGRLWDESALERTFAIEYSIRVNTRNVNCVTGGGALTRRIINVAITAEQGVTLKPGIFLLEDEQGMILRVVRKDIGWELVGAENIDAFFGNAGMPALETAG